MKGKQIDKASRGETRHSSARKQDFRSEQIEFGKQIHIHSPMPVIDGGRDCLLLSNSNAARLQARSRTSLATMTPCLRWSVVILVAGFSHALHRLRQFSHRSETREAANNGRSNSHCVSFFCSTDEEHTSVMESKASTDSKPVFPVFDLTFVCSEPLQCS